MSPRARSGPQRLRAQLLAEGITDARVLDALTKVPRSQFCHPRDRRFAWRDEVLPLGHGATLSQPWVVATMLEALDVQPREQVLDVGSGSGYTTAVLATLGARVVALELEPALVDRARRSLAALEIEAATHCGDAWDASLTGGPFDAILISAAAPEVPNALLELLAPGGRIVAPLGDAEQQELVLISHDPQEDELVHESLASVVFVPLRDMRPFA